MGDDGDDGPAPGRWGLNTSDPRRDDAEITVTAGSPGGFEKYYVIWMVTTWRPDGQQPEVDQASACLDHETVVSWSERSAA